MTVGELKEKLKDLPDDYEVATMLDDYDSNTNSYKVFLIFDEKNEVEKILNEKNNSNIHNIKMYSKKEIEEWKQQK